VLRNQHYSVSKANKAISDYRRAVGDPEGTAELSLFYCEEAVQFANDYGADDAGYCYAIVTMFKQCLKFIQELEAQKQVRFLERLDCLREDIQFGYGVEEEMNELLKEYCFDE
jgi:hypothetical protein